MATNPTLLPAAKPKATLAEVSAMLRRAAPDLQDPVILFGQRGYYARSMGPTPGNDRGIYDDALFIIWPDGFAAFNANTDPSIWRPRVATLKPGIWRYKPGSHGITFNRPGYPYPAFVQAGPVTVRRDKAGDDTGWFGINIHRGSERTTSSLGCQTLPPKQWDFFRDTLNGALKRAGVKSFPYVLVG